LAFDNAKLNANEAISETTQSAAKTPAIGLLFAAAMKQQTNHITTVIAKPSDTHSNPTIYVFLRN
jgi:hypothetical protein